MSLTKIVQVHGRQVIDSRGNPTVEAVVTVGGGASGSAIVPSGASTGEHEAWELRDGAKNRYLRQRRDQGRRERQQDHRQEIDGMDALDQVGVDKAMIALDGTPNKAKLGANAILAVSLATAKAAANQLGLPLFKYLGGPNAKVLPVPMMNIVNGGAHSDAPVDFQEFMIMPKGVPSFSEALRAGCEIFHALKSVLKDRGLSTAVGDEGGFAPNFESADDALETIAKAVKKAGYKLGKDIFIALDVAASRVLRREEEAIRLQEIRRLEAQRERTGCLLPGTGEEVPDHLDRRRLRGERLGRLEKTDRRNGREDPARRRRSVRHERASSCERDRSRRGQLHSGESEPDRLAHRDARRHRAGAEKTAIRRLSAIVRARPKTPTIADIAVATNAGQIKTGSLSRTDRVAKYNQLLRIEEALGNDAIYGGKMR